MWKQILVIFAFSVFVEAERVDPKKYPFIVSITMDDKHICAGNMVISNYIVTSAPCVYGKDAESLTVHLGTVNLTQPGDAYKVLEVKFHPDYDNNKYAYAAALLKTEEMTYKSTVLPVGVSEQKIGSGVTLKAAGWKLDGDLYPDGLLQSKDVTSISNDACGDKLNATIPESVICTQNDDGYRKDREYFSDVGGPVLERETLVGVIVSSNRPSKSKQPDINARISELIDWMIAAIEEK